MLYICAEHEMPGLPALPVLVVAVEDSPFLEPMDALDEGPRADARLQRERPMGHLDPDAVPVDPAVAPAGLFQHQKHVLRRLAAGALAPVLSSEFVVPALQVLEYGPQLLVSTEALPGDVYGLVGAGHHAQLGDSPAGGQVIVYACLAVAVHGRQIDHEHGSPEAFEHLHDSPERFLHVRVGPGVGVEDDYDAAASQPDVLPTGERDPALAAWLRKVPDADDAHCRLATACEAVNLFWALGNP